MLQKLLHINADSNRFKSTVGVSLILLIALNLGIIIHSYFFAEPYEAAEVLTYFIVFTVSILFTMYKLLDLLNEPSEKYTEGIILGTGSAAIVLVYLPSLTFKPLVHQFPQLMDFFLSLYLFSVGLTAIFVVGIVRGSELYAEENTVDDATQMTDGSENESATEAIEEQDVGEENEDTSTEKMSEEHDNEE